MASISAGNDDFIGELLAETIERIGPDGVISLENSSTSETLVIVEEGIKVGKQFLFENISDLFVYAVY